VTFDGKPLQAAEKVYLLLYKPKGYLTTFKDPEGRPTVYDLIGPKQWIFPIGRLDQDTSGLLLLTNDSELCDYVARPESHVPKTYLVKASRLITEEELDQLRNGLQLVDGPTRPAVVKRIRDSEKYSFFEITITEGRNRQVRRMVETLRATVLKLVRVGIGDLRIGSLQIGTARPLTEQELKSLSTRKSR
jgi:pseudouridine synthase